MEIDVIIIREPNKLKELLDEAHKRFPEAYVNVAINNPSGKSKNIKLNKLYNAKEVSFIKKPEMTAWNGIQINLETNEAFLAPDL